MVKNITTCVFKCVSSKSRRSWERAHNTRTKPSDNTMRCGLMSPQPPPPALQWIFTTMEASICMSPNEYSILRLGGDKDRLWIDTQLQEKDQTILGEAKNTLKRPI